MSEQRKKGQSGCSPMTSVFDRTAYERDRDRLPRFIVRPPHGEASAWEHDHGWQLVYEWSVAKYLDKGWECRKIETDDPIVRGESMEADQEKRRKHRREIEAWADEFFASGRLRAVTPSDREDVLRVAEARLREVINDGFLTRVLEASADG